jgi:hypothetical protein
MKTLEPSPRKIHFSSLVTRLPGFIPGLLSLESFQAFKNCIEDRQKNTGFFKFVEYKKGRAKLFRRVIRQTPRNHAILPPECENASKR